MRSRFVSIYSLEDLNNQIKQTKSPLDKIEEDALSSKSTYPNTSLYHPDSDEEEEDEGENEQLVSNDLSLLNSIYHSNNLLLTNDLASTELKVICKCLKDSIITSTPLFSTRACEKRFPTINSLKDLELKKFLQLMFKSKPEASSHSVQNYLLQNLEGEEEIKLLISSNSDIEKDKLVSQLLSYSDDMEQKKDNEEGDEEEDYEDDGLGIGRAKTNNPLTITKKKLIFQNKAIDLEIFDTQLNFYKQKTSLIYYQIAKVFLVIVDNEKCNTPLAFTQIIHRQYEQHASSSNRKLIILDINSKAQQKNIELYCRQNGLIYIRLNKNYTHLPASLINFLFLFTNQKAKKEVAIDWSTADSLKSGIDYNIDEAYNDASPKKNSRRAMSLLSPNVS